MHKTKFILKKHSQNILILIALYSCYTTKMTQITKELEKNLKDILYTVVVSK